jgi:hypothetical protein
MNEHLLKLFQTTLPSVKETVDNLEIALLDEPQVECSVYHHFSPGLYVREVNIPAGTLAIGHFQKTEHLNVFLTGRVTMLNDDGATSEMTAPMLFTGKPGRKCGYIHENVVWLNVYPTDETDVETLEATYLDKSPGFLNHKIEKLSAIADQEDFKKMISEWGINKEELKKHFEKKDDLIPFPSGSYGAAVFNSNLDGKGLFATATFEEGDLIAPVKIKGCRTPAARYVNHGKQPNAEMVRVGLDMHLRAIKKIVGQRGGQMGDEILVNYRQCLNSKGVFICPD